jgi:hypothetical protein
MSRRKQNRLSLLRGAVAAVGIFLVLALTVLAASPELHARLHGHETAPAPSVPASASHPDHGPAGDDDDGCAVTLFAQGLVLTLVLLALAFTGQILRLPHFSLADRVVPESPRYLRLPTQAPPLALS